MGLAEIILDEMGKKTWESNGSWELSIFDLVRGLVNTPL